MHNFDLLTARTWRTSQKIQFHVLPKIDQGTIFATDVLMFWLFWSQLSLFAVVVFVFYIETASYVFSRSQFSLCTFEVFIFDLCLQFWLCAIKNIWQESENFSFHWSWSCCCHNGSKLHCNVFGSILFYFWTEVQKDKGNCGSRFLSLALLTLTLYKRTELEIIKAMLEWMNQSICNERSQHYCKEKTTVRRRGVGAHHHSITRRRHAS